MTGSPDSGARPPDDVGPRTPLTPLASALLVAGVLAALLAFADAALRRGAQEYDRQVVLGQARAQALALTGALQRRSALLEGFRAWLTLRGETDGEEMHAFTTELLPAAPGLRAMQVVVDGVIRHSFPDEGNEGVLGFDLMRHPDPRVVTDLRRAATSDALVVTVTDLIQGGRGVIMRAAVDPGTEGTPVATLVQDLEPLLLEAGLDPGTEDVRYHLRDASGHSVWPPRGAPPDGGLEVPVSAGPDTWRLSVEPTPAGALPWATPLRIGEGLAAVLVLLAGTVTYQLTGRRQRLETAVRVRTRQLARANRELEDALAALRNQDERMAMALRAGGVTTWEWDLETDRVRHFPGTMDQIDIDPDTGSASFEQVAARVHPDDMEAFRAAELGTREDGADFDVEYRMVLPDGSVQWRRDVGRVGPGGGRVLGAVADVTRSKELEEQLSHARKLESVGQLAGGIAHDFNNLMQVILGNATLLRADPQPDELELGLIEIVQAAEHASRLTAQLLAFSRRRPIRPVVLDLGAEVERAGSMLRRVLDESTVLTILPAPGPLPVRVDPSQLAQVLVNLAVNARDAMPSGGALRVRTDAVTVGAGAEGPLSRGRYALLEVSDDGTGIPYDIQARIFDPFFTTKEPGRGTGLGLASVYGTVRQAGGDVSVSSEPGKGATFRILLPLVPDDAPELAGAHEGSPGSGARSGHGTAVGRVLVVEDEPAVRHLARRVLEQAGHEVVEAADGAEALARFRGGLDPDLLVVDVTLNGELGTDVVRSLRDERPGLRVLFVSGYPADERLADWRGDPRAGFLQKPFLPTELRQRAEELLA